MAFDPDAFLASSDTAGGFDPDKFLKENEDEGPSLMDRAGSVGMGALETINAPLQVAGEAIRGAGESEPLRIATAENPRGFRAPSIVQRLAPSLRTPEPPADPFQKAYQGLEGIANLPRGIQAASDVVTGQPDLAAQIGGAGMALGLMPPKIGAAEKATEFPTSVPRETPLEGGVPPERPSAGPPPPPGGTPPPPPAGTNPLKEVNDFIAQKYGEQAAKPGRIENFGRYLQNFSQEMGGKDIGIQPRQIQSMGPGFIGNEKAEALIDYAREKGYFNPTLTDVARKAQIKDVLAKTGQQVDAIRSVADTRGTPPVADILNQVKTQLTEQYGVDAPREIKKVLLKIQKAPPTFSGMADLATDLNKAKTMATKLGQHPGPTTDAANIISRINNEAIRSVLNPQEAESYTQSLRDFGAHKKLEQTVAAAGRRAMAARSNQRGILGRLYQEALDRGGYRIAGNVAHRLGKGMIENPANFKTLPDFFEQMAHETGDVLDETMQGPQMAHGGIVGEVDHYLTSKYGACQ